MGSILSQLRQDHANFALMLNAIDREVDIICEGGSPNLELLKDIALYFRTYLDTYHHAKEDYVYGLLMLHMPKFGTNALSVLENHRGLAMGTECFEQALKSFNRNDQTARETLCRELRAFVSHEREHLKAEDDIIFPAAERWLRAEHWAEIDRFGASKDNLKREETTQPHLDRILRSIKTTKR
jgi:hemerythrin-like domain-containing protein